MERPGDAQGHNVFGGVLLKLGDLEGAIQEYRQAARLDPALTEPRVGLAQALTKAGRTDEARAPIAEVQRLKEVETRRAQAMVLVEMAARQLENGEAARAVASLRDAVAASPDFADAQYLLGLALQRAGVASAEREEALLEAVRLDPGHAEARYEWARLLAGRGDMVAAVDQLRKAVELQPSLVGAQRELARIALLSRDWATAAAALRAVLAWGERDPALHDDLALALEGLGEREEAARERVAAARRAIPGSSKR
jgi:Flp pilus assembly protein TadD